MAQPRFLIVGNAQTAVSWRLLGANNRELGRSAGTFPDPEAGLAAVRDVVDRIAAATPSIASTEADRTGGWNWRLSLAGQPVAVAGRSYLRHRECVYSLAHFLAAAPQALLVAAKQR